MLGSEKLLTTEYVTMKLNPKHKPLPGNVGEAFIGRVKKSRTKKAEAAKTKKKQRKRGKQ